MTNYQRDVILSALRRLDAAHAAADACTDEIRVLLFEVGTSKPRSPGSDPPPSARGPARPLADREVFAVRWRGKTCPLGDTIMFRLFEQLSRRTDRYVSLDALLRDAWRGDIRSADTVRSVVRHLRSKLETAGMKDLAAAIRGRTRCYGFMLDGAL
jgi:hypothetical protein